MLVTAAKAFGLNAIDLVCIDYKNEATLKEECEEGRYSFYYLEIWDLLEK